MSENTAPQADPVPPSIPTMERILSYIKKWPTWIARLIKDLKGSIQELPKTGTWEEPIIYAATSGLIVGVIQASFVFGISFGLAMNALISGVILAPVGVFAGAFVANLILGVLGKDPGYFRTVTLAARLSILSPAAIALVFVHPYLAYAPALYGFYVFYFYAQIAAEVPQKKAMILVGIILGLSLLSSFGAGLGLRRFY